MPAPPLGEQVVSRDDDDTSVDSDRTEPMSPLQPEATAFMPNNAVESANLSSPSF